MGNETIITSASLSNFFYKDLSLKNKIFPCPLPEEFLFYSSLTLEKYSLSSRFFEIEEGRATEKILGMRYLESKLKTRDEKLSELKDIGDTVLVLLGFFSDSVNNKLISREYYLSIAQNAYSDLGKMDSSFYDIPHFYDLFASSLSNTIKLLEAVATEFKMADKDQYLLNLEISHKKVV